MSELFEIPPCYSPRLAWLNRAKSELDIFTHSIQGKDWMAFSKVKALEFLEGYDISPSVKPMDLFARYCRLLDEAGLLADHEETENAAIETVAIKSGWKLWNEEALDQNRNRRPTKCRPN